MSDIFRPRLSPWWRLRQTIVSRWIARGLAGTPPGPALKTDLFDEASGPFHHAPDLSGPGGFVGLDKDPGVVRAAKVRLGEPARCVVADVRHLPFAAGAFATVVSLSTLDHFERATDIEASLRELARVQPAGGRLLLTLDNPANPEVALRRLLPRGLVRRLRADTFYLGETVGERRGGRLLTDAGYEVERVAYLIHALRYPAIRLLRWVDRPRLTGLRRIVEGLLLAAETLDKLPTRGVTGHYVAWVSRKNG